MVWYESMNILYINASFWGGGAEKVSRQLYYGLKNERVNTFYLAGRYQKNLPEDIEVIYRGFFERAISAILGMVNHNFLFGTILARKKIISIVKREKIDIIHFHNLRGNYIGPTDLSAIKKFCPNIVITLHDMWLFTGCCPNGMSCNEWENEKECRNCHGNEWLEKGTKRGSLYLKCKSDSLSGRNYCFVSPSKWLISCCKRSYLRRENLQLIPNGVNIESFQLLDKQIIRNKYNIPQDKRILLFSAHNVDSPYKGLAYLLEAIELLSNKERYYLLIIGHLGDLHFDSKFEISNLGYISNEHMMNELYCAADLFILPSMADTFPLTALESMASGTPVLAFNTGGIPESVTEEVGWCVQAGNSKDLRDEIENIFIDSQRLIEKTEKCREYIEKYYSENSMLMKYQQLYTHILEQH